MAERDEKPRPTPQSAAERARLDRIFGDALPETTSDERARGRARGEDPDPDAWLRQNVPPHHG